MKDQSTKRVKMEFYNKVTVKTFKGDRTGIIVGFENIKTYSWQKDHIRIGIELENNPFSYHPAWYHINEMKELKT